MTKLTILTIVLTLAVCGTCQGIINTGGGGSKGNKNNGQGSSNQGNNNIASQDIEEVFGNPGQANPDSGNVGSGNLGQGSDYLGQNEFRPQDDFGRPESQNGQGGAPSFQPAYPQGGLQGRPGLQQYPGNGIREPGRPTIGGLPFGNPQYSGPPFGRPQYGPPYGGPPFDGPLYGGLHGAPPHGVPHGGPYGGPHGGPHGGPFGPPPLGSPQYSGPFPYGL